MSAALRPVSSASTSRTAGQDAIRPLRPRSAPKLALAGCGVVGGALVQLVVEGAVPGVRLADVGAVLVRDPARARGVPLDGIRFTADPMALLDRRADVVVEALPGVDPALTLARATLRRGARYITANKRLIAEHGTELARLAERHGGQLDFEAAVGGAIPVVRAIRDGLAGVGVHTVRGVLNGTTNFVLSRALRGDSVESAVAAAQALGYAEADPSRDLDGLDAADKLRLLAWLAFGIAPHQLPVTIGGFAGAAALLDAARSEGRVVRQVAEIRRTSHGLSASVTLQRLSTDDPLASVDLERNRVVVESRSAGTLVFEGPGAGGFATAGALVADLLRPGRALPRPTLVHVQQTER